MTGTKVGSETLRALGLTADTILQAISDGVSIQDRDFRIVYMNESLRQWVGGDHSGEYCYKVYAGLEKVCPSCPCLETFATGAPGTSVRTGVDSASQPLFVEVSTTALYGPGGDVVACVEIVRNVTEQKLLEQEIDRRNQETVALARRLKKEVERQTHNFEYLLNKAPIGIHIYDDEMRFVYANAAFWQFAQGQDYMGMTFDAIFDGYPDAQLVRHIKRRITDGLKGKGAVDSHFSIGGFFFDVHYVPIERAGRRQVMIMFNDMTETAKLQQRLRDYTGELEQKVERRTAQLKASEAEILRRNEELSAINAVSTIVNQSLDLDEVLHQSLVKVLEVMGSKTGVVLLYDSGHDCLALKAQLGLARAKAKLLQSRLPAIRTWSELRTAWAQVERSGDSDRRQSLLMVVPLKAKDKIMGFMAIAGGARPFGPADEALLKAIGNDIGIAIENARLFSEAEEKTERLQRAYAELMDLDRLKSELVSVVSHELRTPLATIKGYVEIVKDGLVGKVSQVQKEKLARAEQQVDKLTRLVGDLLDLAAMETKKPRIVRRAFQVRSLLNEAVAAIRPLATAKGQRLTVRIPAGMSTLAGDVSSLARVLVNLLENAVKFTPAGGRIRLSVNDEGKSVKFTVADNGIGIAAEHLPRIFDRFFMVQTNAARQFVGTGLGLAIVKGIVEAHGGAAWAESSPGKGTAIHFTLSKVGGKGG